MVYTGRDRHAISSHSDALGTIKWRMDITGGHHEEDKEWW